MKLLRLIKLYFSTPVADRERLLVLAHANLLAAEYQINSNGTITKRRVTRD